jgi:hypothetical protein
MPKRVDQECGCAHHHAEVVFEPSNAHREMRLEEGIYRAGSTDWLGSVAGTLHGMTEEISDPCPVGTK